MKVEVVVPEEFMGPVVGDLNSRRGRIETTEPRAGSQVVTAVVPLSEMFGYSTDLALQDPGKSHLLHAFLSLRTGSQAGQ